MRVSQRSRFRLAQALLALVCAAAAGGAAAIDFRSVAVPAAILYDAPSAKARKLFLLGRDYPVEVLVAIEGWIKVRDASGELAWIEAGNLADKRTVLVRVPRAEVRQGATETAEILFYAEQDVVFELIGMDGNYARVRHADGTTGYVRVTQIWGL
jgi:SH3-like domain-containing protein